MSTIKGLEMLTIDQVLTAALNLSDPDRLELIEALLASVQPVDQPPFDVSWRKIIRQRSAELSAGRVVATHWVEVKRRGREAIGG